MYSTVDKQLTRTLLQRAGVAVPEGRKFSRKLRDEAVKYAHNLGWPVVVKPLAGTGGAGVTANVQSDEQLLWAIDTLGTRSGDEFVIERHIQGEDYRFIVLDDRVLSVLHCRQANVVGDGASTVSELIEEKNRIKRMRHRLQGRQIRLDERGKFQLQRQGLSWDSVVREGKRVSLTTSGNLALGGDSIQVLDETHPSLIDMAVRAVRAIPGLRYSGIDFLITDHRRHIDEQEAGICEVNASPANGAHHFPLFGEIRDVTGDLVLSHCEQVGVPLEERSSELCIDLDIRGLVQGVGYRAWMTALARELGVSGWIRNAVEPDRVMARLAGEVGPVSAICSLAIEGPTKASVHSVQTRHHAGTWPVGEFGA